MAITYKDISGTSTSEVAALITHQNILSGDLFLVSQQALTCTSPSRTYQWHGEQLNNFYASRRLSYGALSSQVFSDLCSEFGIKSMAWESSADYSLYDHVHHYSKISVEQIVKLPDDESQHSSVSAIAAVRVGSKSTTVYMPEIKRYSQPKPYIGQLKFLAVQAINEVDCNSAEFDGWVYPDGRELRKSKFTKAYSFFGDDYGTASSSSLFKIPNLTSFIKIVQPTSSNKTTSLVSEVPANDVLKDHQHTADNLQINGQIDYLSVSFENVRNTEAGAYCHGVDKSSQKAKQTYDIWFTGSNVRISDGQTTGSSEIQKTTHPTYDHLPVLMYIGVD